MSSANPDHPRACGANNVLLPRGREARGSSPRMRGKLGEHLHRQTKERIIPAHAGQTRCQRTRLPPSPDHPRACGANVAITPRHAPPAGSSPRMRGKLVLLELVPSEERIIPAHAGQTLRALPSRRTGTDHPRACGANRLISVAAVCRAGSSPRMRGKPGRGFDVEFEHRIIPAHAGQTGANTRASGSTTDHPRACGANGPVWPGSAWSGGSSPRMRGKRAWASPGACMGRIIPAHAGQTSRFTA